MAKKIGYWKSKDHMVLLHKTTTYIGYWKSKDCMVLLHKSALCTQVELDFGVICLQAELAPSDDFENVCLFETKDMEAVDFDVVIKTQGLF